MIADRYRVIALLGRGGMGEVYSADDLKLGQRVALKFLPADRLKSSSWRDQFYAEVRMARQVAHPNVCRMYDVGESDGRLFLSMEFVDGEDLASLLRRIGRLPDDKAVEVAQQLCAGLAAAHASGVLHRDLKPSNVMLDGKGRARITDFGLAIATADADREKSPAGTPGYLAPELYDGRPPSVQSDVYALGLVLYELFTGKRPFEASSAREFHRKQSETNPTPPSNVVKNLDPAVEKAILRCLDRDPSQRPRSAHSVAAALPGGDPLAAALAAGETPSPDMIAAAGPQGSLKPAIAWGCLLASVALMLITVMILAPRNSDWGRTPMPKSPEVLADRAQELAQKLGYPDALDRAYWIGSDQDYLDYVSNDASGKNLQRASEGQAWPSAVGFWFRQSPQWMTPVSDAGVLRVTRLNPPYETSGMLTLKLDVLARTPGEQAFEIPFPPLGEMRLVPGVVAGVAQLIRYRCERLDALPRDGEGQLDLGGESPSPVMDALFTLEEPRTGTDGTLSWTVDIQNPATGEEIVLGVKEMTLPDGVTRPYAMWLAGHYPRALDGLARILSLDMRVIDPAWIGMKLRKLLNYSEPFGDFMAFVPGERRQQTWPSTVAYLARLIIHRYAMLGILDEQGYPVQSMGILDQPRGANEPKVMAGGLCSECGNHAVIRKDGCEFCTACGAVGACG